MVVSLLCNAFSKAFTTKKVFLRRMGAEAEEEFYQRILQVYEKDDSIRINRIEKAPACEKGASFISKVSRVNVFGYKVQNNKKQGYQRSLIVKELPALEQQILYRSKIAAENENLAYNKIIPALEGHSTGNLPVANCIYADDRVIILQDLTVDGYQAIRNESGGLTLEQCELVLEALAKLHAASFVFKNKQPEDFESCTKLTKEILFYGSDSKLLDYQTEFLQGVLELFQKLPESDENSKALQVLQDLKQNSRSTLRNLLLNPREHSVICHGDTWAGNVMRYNSVASDLSYVLYVNLEPELRVKNTNKLLKCYLSSLLRHTKEKGVNMDDVLTMQWLEEEMDTFAIYGVIFGMWILPVFFVKEEDVEISKKKLSDSSNVSKNAGPDYQKRLMSLIYGYVRSLK